MHKYHHIHDFTPDGLERFSAFLGACARPDVSGEACRLDCLGTLEEQLNEAPGRPLRWRLGGLNTATGQPLAFAVDREWLRIEPARLQG